MPTESEWFSSSSAKRKLGAIVRAVHESGGRVGIGGSRDAARYFLEDVDRVELDGSEQRFGIDQFRTFWPDKTEEVGKTGNSVVIEINRKARAVFSRNETLVKVKNLARQRAKDAQAREFQAVQKRLEGLAKQLASVASRIERRLEVIDRRFVELWRERNLGNS